ncbi:HpcH/HpaI aldolase [Apiospora kogelbergensis]
MGIPGDYENPRLTEAYERTIAACNKVGKYVGVGGLHARLDLVEKFCGMGARWVMAATDGPLLLAGASKRGSEMAQLSARVTGASNGNGVTNGNGMKNGNSIKNGIGFTNGNGITNGNGVTNGTH